MIDLTDFNPQYVQHLTLTGDDRIRFKLRSRTVGVEEYTCIFCGAFNRQRLRPQSFILRCANENCRRSLGYGRIAYLLDPGPKVAPPDLIIPRGLLETFPEGDLARWQSGQPIHRVHVLHWPEER